MANPDDETRRHRWRPIRVRLRIAVGLLTFALAILAGAGWWGTNRYGRLADEVTHVAREIPRITDLNRIAVSMQSSHRRAQSTTSILGVMGQVRLDETATAEHRQHLRWHSDDFRETLGRLRDSIGRRDDDAVIFSPGELRKRLDQIGQTHAAHREHCGPLGRVGSHAAAAGDHTLDTLVAQTEELAAHVQQGLEDYAGDVRTRYRTATVISAVALVVAVGTLASLWIAFHISIARPFNLLLDGSRLVADGQFEHTIELGTGDELDELASAMNGMTQKFNELCHDLDARVRIQAKELVRGDRLASVGFLAAGVAHEINNPLAAIAWSSESLGEQLRTAGRDEGGLTLAPELADELVEELSRIEREAFRSTDIIRRLLDFSRLGDASRESTPLAAIVRDLVPMVLRIDAFRGKTIDVVESGGGGPVRGWVNDQEFRQVILNLITNALQSTGDDGAVTIEIRGVGRHAVLDVVDNGCGMSDETLEHLFEPFYTRRRGGGGTGLGLSITHRIVNSGGGTLTAHSDGPGRGSTMRLCVPTADPAVQTNDNVPEPVHRQWAAAA